MKHLNIFIIVMMLSTYIGITVAEEGGSGHYLPGSMASFMDGVSPEPAFIARINAINYDGKVGSNIRIPIAGFNAIDVEAKSKALALTLFWAPEWGAGEKWSYAMSTTIPWMSLEVRGDVDFNGIDHSVKDKVTGLGDIILMPIMFNYHHSSDLNTNYRIAV
ncbi:MAG: transporter, partial [Thiotrichaceae bacterium]|nr:transporter [Thiotrichaceae bacterium]